MIRLDKKLKDFKRGWLVGDFEPVLFNSKDIEIAVQEYKAGDKEAPHYHAKAIEYNLILEGLVTFNGDEFNKDEICIINKNDVSDFRAITDAKVLVIKTPSVIGDKYIVV